MVNQTFLLFLVKDNFFKRMRVQTKGTLSPRVDHAFAVFHDNAYVFGGTDGKRKLRDLQELSLGNSNIEYKFKYWFDRTRRVEASPF